MRRDMTIEDSGTVMDTNSSPGNESFYDPSSPPPGHHHQRNHRYEVKNGHLLHNNSQNNNINNNNCHQQKHRLIQDHHYDHGMAHAGGHDMELFSYERACSVSSCNPDSSGTLNGKTGIRKTGGGSCGSSSGSGSSADASSTDEDSELEYGPGIVAKLKSKFLRYSMKTENNKSARNGIGPSSLYSRGQKLKRCSSLENILDAPASSCCVERHRIDILDHKDLLRVSSRPSASIPAAAVDDDDEISTNVTKAGYSSGITMKENEGNVLSNGVRLLNQRNLSSNVTNSLKTTNTTNAPATMMTTAMPSAKPTAPVIRNYCLKSSPPVPATANSTAALITGTSADHRDNNHLSSSPSIVNGKSVTGTNGCANSVPKGVTGVPAIVNGIKSRDNPFLKQYVSSCVAAASAGSAAGIKCNPSPGNGAGRSDRRSEPVPGAKETDLLSQSKETPVAVSESSPASESVRPAVVPAAGVPRVTARRFQSNSKATTNNNIRHPHPPQHYHVYGSSVVKRAKSMESLLFDAESRILPHEEEEEDDDDDDDEHENHGDDERNTADAFGQKEGEGKEQQEGNCLSEQRTEHEAAACDIHEQDKHDIVVADHHEADRLQVQDEEEKQNDKKEGVSIQDQEQPPAAPPAAVTATTPVPTAPARRPLPPLPPHPSPRHPPPTVPPPPPPQSQSPPAPEQTLPIVRAGVSSRVAIVPPIVHETSPSAGQMTCNNEAEALLHNEVRLQQETTAESAELCRNLVSSAAVADSVAGSASSSLATAVCTESRSDIESQSSASLVPSESTPGTGNSAPSVATSGPPVAPARSSLLHKNRLKKQIVADEGGANQSSPTTTSSSLSKSFPAQHLHHQQRSASTPSESAIIANNKENNNGVKRSLVRGSSLPPVKPVIAQKPKSLKVNPLEHLKAIHTSTTTSPAAPVISPFIFTPPLTSSSLNSSSLLIPQVTKQTVAAAGKPLPLSSQSHVVERQSLQSKDKAVTPAEQRLLTPPQQPAAAAPTNKTKSAEKAPVVTESSADSRSLLLIPSATTNTTTTTAAASLTSATQSASAAACLSATAAAAADVIVPPLIPQSSSSLPSSGVTEILTKSSSLSSSSTLPCTASSSYSVTSAPAPDTRPSSDSVSSSQSIPAVAADPSSDILKVLLDLHEQKPSMIISNSVNKKSNSNCMIFDFRGKNVKPQLAITSPFGRSAVIQTSESDDAELEKDSPDSPELTPTLIFLGENEIIGNGSLLKMRNKKLRIHFNETSLTSTYEYPSESSLCQHFDHYMNESDSVITSSTNGESSAPNRVPEKDRHPASSPSSSSLGEPVATETLIKPANSEEASSWSASSAASDLLF